MAKLAVDSNELTGIELGRSYITLGVLYHQVGKFIDAKAAFERSLRILERDPEHVGDYAAALNNYGEVYSDAGEFDVAKAMWVKALHLRQTTGDNAAIMRSLVNLAHLALMQRRMHEAKQCLKQASDVMRVAHDLIDDDFVLFLETQASLAQGEGHTLAAVADFGRALDLCRRTRGEEHWLTGWEHLLRGKAYAQLQDMNGALADMREGLAIIEHALGRNNTMYLGAQIAYSQVLDRAGFHAEAAQLRAAAEQARKDAFGAQCIGCTINIAGFP